MGERHALTLSEGQGLALASALRLELKKLRHKRLWLIALCMVAMQLLWLGQGWFGHRGGGTTPGYPALLLQAPALNAVFLPLLSTVIAATVCDVEAGGDMLKSLLTLQRAGSLFWTKLLVSMGMLAIVVTLQEAGLVGIAVAAKLDAIPARELAIYWVSTFVVCVFCRRFRFWRPTSSCPWSRAWHSRSLGCSRCTFQKPSCAWCRVPTLACSPRWV